MMEASVESAAPRPLDLGEILDRAVTLFVRNGVMLCSIEAIAIVPLVVFATLGQSGAMFAAIQRAMATRNPADINAIFASSRPGPFDIAEGVVALLVTPWIAGAVVYAASRMFAGEPVTLAQSLRGSLSRYWTLLVGLAVNLLALSIIIFAVALGFGLSIVAFVGVAHVVHLGPVVSAVIGAILAAGFLAVMAALCGWSFSAANLTFVAAVMERRGLLDTAFSGFARAFARGQRRRSLLAGIVMLVLFTGVDFVGLGVGMLLTALTKWVLFTPLFAALARTIAAVLTTVMITIFYFDVRLRREGGDLMART